MKKVAVLLSSYNGERFIKEQIDSILNQKGIEAYLFVRDDGSKDSTIKIINDYKATNDKVNLIEGENENVGNSFMDLLYSTPDNFDYYAFSDQDDIWQLDKLEKAIEFIEQKNIMLYTSNQECVDANGQSLGLRYTKEEYIHLAPIEILFLNKVSGCTMVMTNELYKILTVKEHRPSRELLHNRIHDVWVAMVASIYNSIGYDERAFIKYRQHGGNVVGAYRPSLAKRIKSRIHNLFNKELQQGRSRLAREICDRFGKDVQIDEEIIRCEAKKGKDKMYLIKHASQLVKYTGESKIGFICKVVLGLF